MHILICDDSRVMRAIVTRTLRQAGFDTYQIKEADNGRSGLESALSDPPGLILSDWNMPEMSGLDFLRNLRANGSRVPFGFVTSECSDEMRALAASEGALFLITKPFNDVTFRETLGAVLV